MTNVTLLICTRNRHDKLATTLDAVTRAANHATDVTVEVIVVDNGSTDTTPQLLTDWHKAQRFSVKLLREQRAGLARARNIGLAQCEGSIVAMTDDDCILHDDYFAALVAAFAETTAPTIIGGRILPGDAADLLLTVKLEDHPMAADPRAFPGGFVMGANMAFSREILALVGDFDERFGAGAPFVAAEDTDFLLRATKLGIPVLYDPHMIVDHHHGRRRTSEGRRLLAGYSFGDGALYAKHILRDRRVINFIRADFRDAIEDFKNPAVSHNGIERFYVFRLSRKLSGFIAYLRVVAGAWLGRTSPA